MRALLIAVAIVLGITLLLAALVAVTTGKAYIFTIGAGYGRRAGGIIAAAQWTCVAGIAAGVALHLAAHLLPRRYYPLMRWRDVALAVSVAAAFALVALVVWRQIAYGTI